MLNNCQKLAVATLTRCSPAVTAGTVRACGAATSLMGAPNHDVLFLLCPALAGEAFLVINTD